MYLNLDDTLPKKSMKGKLVHCQDFNQKSEDKSADP